mmetsp:Transcript_42742/g.91106  ORF Transcript_42742/g.91106 Transcript_42742/m.91106 type:complete len:235 (+) Transcript_42742:1061-1765(+)
MACIRWHEANRVPEVPRWRFSGVHNFPEPGRTLHSAHILSRARALIQSRLLRTEGHGAAVGVVSDAVFPQRILTQVLPAPARRFRTEPVALHVEADVLTLLRRPGVRDLRLCLRRHLGGGSLPLLLHRTGAFVLLMGTDAAVIVHCTLVPHPAEHVHQKHALEGKGQCGAILLRGDTQGHSEKHDDDAVGEESGGCNIHCGPPVRMFLYQVACGEATDRGARQQQELDEAEGHG